MKSGRSVPVGVALADSLLVCVLQEPLSDASVPHLKCLLLRLEVRDGRTPGRDEVASVQPAAPALSRLQHQRLRSVARCKEISGCQSLLRRSLTGSGPEAEHGTALTRSDLQTRDSLTRCLCACAWVYMCACMCRD